MAEYLIHACPARGWYVDDYLIPSMLEQGINRDQIEVWMDDRGMGNLISFMRCCEAYGKRGSGRWHLQDDVCISSDFKQKTEEFDDGIVCGFFKATWQGLTPQAGRVPAVYMWNSFQCIRIPDKYIGECAEWFFTDAAYRSVYEETVRINKCDDSMWMDFLTENHLEETVLNLKPSIVEHVDFLLGGSVINKGRDSWARGDLWEDTEAFEKLRSKLAADSRAAFIDRERDPKSWK